MKEFPGQALLFRLLLPHAGHSDINTGTWLGHKIRNKMVSCNTHYPLPMDDWQCIALCEEVLSLDGKVIENICKKRNHFPAE
jgi:hypothetical protein